MSGLAHTYPSPVRSQRGVTLIELMITATISLLIVAGLSSVIQVTVESKAALEQQNELTREAGFAMERMVRAVSHSRRLLLPLTDNPATNWPEDVREQTVPPSPPIGASTLATAVLAVTVPEYIDLDFNGIPDADNDGDGRIDEDPPRDVTWDLAAGIPLIDDDGDGSIDEGFFDYDDDESAGVDEDRSDGLDNDGDGSIDEDSGADMNGDGCPGLCGVDDDGDGLVDEGSASDDDEDGVIDEDFFGTVVFYLDSGVVKERGTVPWDISGGGSVNGLDYIVSDIAANATRLRFERVADSPPGWVLVDITLELASDAAQSVSLNRRVRVGGAL